MNGSDRRSERGVTGEQQRARESDFELWKRAERILLQEIRTGYADRAVIGGLDRFLSNWLASLETTGNETALEIARRVFDLLDGYSGLPVDARSDQVRAATVVLREALNGGSKRTDAKSGSASAGAIAHGTTSRPATPSRKPRASDPRRQLAVALDDPVLALRGVGKHRAGLLAKLGLERVRDLLYHFPRDYRDYRQVQQGRRAALRRDGKCLRDRRGREGDTRAIAPLSYDG